MIRSRSTWLCALLLAPMGAAVEVPSDSLPQPSRVTTLRGAAGGGVYGRDVRVSFGFVEGCAGPEELNGDYFLRNEYTDVGGEVETSFSPHSSNPRRRMNGTVHLGIRGGVIRDQSTLETALPINPLTGEVVVLPGDADGITDTYYADPFISFEWAKIGFGVGLLMSSAPLKTGEPEEVPLDDDLDATVSGHVRLGVDAFHVLYRHWEGVPVYSGGGQHVFGAGSDVRPLHVFVGGATGGPYDSDVVLTASVGVDLTRHVRLDGTYRFGSTYAYSDTLGSYQFDQWGASAGLTYTFYHH
jgi:hypothetical protein